MPLNLSRIDKRIKEVPAFKDALGALTITRAALQDYKEMIKERAQIRFENTNGCKSCRGRGWIVTWDTLDCMRGSYAEYGSCKREECTEKTRVKSGLWPVNNKYDKLQANAGWDHKDEMNAAETDWFNMIKESVKEAEQKAAMEFRKAMLFHKPIRGKRVVVAPLSENAVGKHDKKSSVGKGRVAVGTEGVIFYTRDIFMQTSGSDVWGYSDTGKYAGSVGIATSDRKDARGFNADVAWVDAKHLMVIDKKSETEQAA